MADQSRPRRRPHLDPDAAAAGLVARRMLDRERPARRTGDHGARFAAAAARPPDEGVSAGDETAAGLLATAPIRGMGRIAYSTNATFVLEFDVAEPGAEDRPLRAVYKPARGERPLWDFPHGLYRREVGAYVVSEALGWGLVPETVVREGPLGPGVAPSPFRNTARVRA